jgi:hypothetical protein
MSTESGAAERLESPEMRRRKGVEVGRGIRERQVQGTREVIAQKARTAEANVSL